MPDLDLRSIVPDAWAQQCMPQLLQHTHSQSYRIIALRRRQSTVQAHSSQHMSAADSISHPAASSLQDQLDWEQALTGSNHSFTAGTFQADNNTKEVPLADCIQLVTPHPAVGGTQAECAAWEAVLGSNPAVSSVDGGQSASQQPPVFAVVECGSHSTRLLISSGSSDIVRLTQDTHLGAAVSPQTRTSAAPAPSEAAAATLAAVQEYKQLLDQHMQHLAGVAAVATAAVREAVEGPAIAAAISEVLQCPLRILSGGPGGSAGASSPQLWQHSLCSCGSQVGNRDAHLAGRLLLTRLAYAAVTAKPDKWSYSAVTCSHAQAQRRPSWHFKVQQQPLAALSPPAVLLVLVKIAAGFAW